MRRAYLALFLLTGCCLAVLFGLQEMTPILTSPSPLNRNVQADRTPQQATPVHTHILSGQGGLRQPSLNSDTITYPPNCRGTTSTPQQALFYFGPGWTIDHIHPKYATSTAQMLCYDDWSPSWGQPGGTWLPIQDFLATAHWPTDFFSDKAGNQILILSSPTIANNTLSSTNQGNPGPTTPQSNCDFVIHVGFPVHIDLCSFVNTILTSTVLSPLKQGVGSSIGNANSFLWTTPAGYSYGNEELTPFWNNSIMIINALLVVIIAWIGLRYMISKSFGNWLSYADLLETLPRLVMAILVAYLSGKFCQLMIDGSNALGSAFHNDLLGVLQNDPQDLMTLFLQIILSLLSLLLILEAGIRYAILFVLLAFAPIWGFSACLRETQFIFKACVRALFFITLLQPCQTAILDVGQYVTRAIGGDPGNVLSYLISIALMIFVLALLFIFLRLSGMAALPSALAANFALPATLWTARTDRAVGTGLAPSAVPTGTGKGIVQVRKGIATAPGQVSQTSGDSARTTIWQFQPASKKGLVRAPRKLRRPKVRKS